MKPTLGCPCGETNIERVLEYKSKPDGETSLMLHGQYLRHYDRCILCKHFFSSHKMCLDELYSGAYSQATYGSNRENVFEKIMNLPKEKSDNVARCERINDFSKNYKPQNLEQKTLLDVGSGLGVFPARMQMHGWNVTALDPDAKAIEHITAKIGCKCIHGDFIDKKIADSSRFDLITFNKVLEHVEEPLRMLRRSNELLKDDGIVYVELPDGENAFLAGESREEFFIEHHHVFSATSATLLINRADLKLLRIDILREASGKYTIALFCGKASQ